MSQNNCHFPKNDMGINSSMLMLRNFNDFRCIQAVYCFSSRISNPLLMKEKNMKKILLLYIYLSMWRSYFFSSLRHNDSCCDL